MNLWSLALRAPFQQFIDLKCILIDDSYVYLGYLYVFILTVDLPKLDHINFHVWMCSCIYRKNERCYIIPSLFMILEFGKFLYSSLAVMLHSNYI